MTERDKKLLPPPPIPPIITLDDDEEDDGGAKEDGEILSENEEDAEAASPSSRSNNNKNSKKSKKKKNKKHQQQEKIPDDPAEASDIEITGDDLYELDDGDGIDITMNINDDEVFKKLQADAGLDEDHDITINISETPRVTRRSGTCFNCGGSHTLNECTLPHDRRKINRNRQSFGSTKKERIYDQTVSKFKPGKLSAELLEALNLNEDEYPQWIYRMRDAGPLQGYPPAYLKRVKPDEKRLAFFCDDPTLTKAVDKVEIDFDPDKIIYYDGFNKVDGNCLAERAVCRNVPRNQRWQKFDESSYPIEMQKFIKDIADNKKSIDTRKRQHGYDDHQQQQQYSKKELEKLQKKKEKNRLKHQRERERKKVEKQKGNGGTTTEKKLSDGVRNINLDEKPQKSTDDQAAANKKLDTKQQRKKEANRANHQYEKERKRFEKMKLEEAQKKLVNDFQNTDFEKEPQKILMVDDQLGVFMSNTQRHKYDQAKSRSEEYLQKEANWSNTMKKEEKAAAAKKAEKEKFAKQEKDSKKQPQKSFKETRAEKLVAEREEKEKKRLKIGRKVIDKATQTEKVRILPWIDEEDDGIIPVFNISIQESDKGRFERFSETPAGRPTSSRSNTHIIYDDQDTPASPELPPVVSRYLTEDQAAPKAFLVPTVDDRRMPNSDNFALGITPFQYDNTTIATNRLEKLEALIKAAKNE